MVLNFSHGYTEISCYRLLVNTIGKNNLKRNLILIKHLLCQRPILLTKLILVKLTLNLSWDREPSAVLNHYLFIALKFILSATLKPILYNISNYIIKPLISTPTHVLSSSVTLSMSPCQSIDKAILLDTRLI